MGAILVSGLINIETTVQVDGFPVEYRPVRYPFFGVNASVSGVGYNVAKALTTLGSRVRFLSMIGKDLAARQVYQQLETDRIPGEFLAAELDHTPRSVILYEPSGRRMINVDLKDVQEKPYPAVLFGQALHGVSLAVLCNINFSRPMLAEARSAGIPIATDVHAISDLSSPYDGDFMAAATVLFMSDELLPCSPRAWIEQLWARYGTPVAVVGLGADGALLGVRADNRIEHVPAVHTREVVNTIGAGDALFSCFVHFFARDADPYAALRRAVVFASYKIGVAGAADGFLEEAALDRVYAEVLGR
jgi:ribokinase